MRRALLALLLLLPGCAFVVDYDGSAYSCAADGLCPPGYACRNDGHCHPPGEGVDRDPPDASTAADGAVAPEPPPAAVVGSFMKASSGDPAEQVVPHQLGQVPALAIFWTSDSSGGQFPRFNVSVAVCDATRDCRAVAFSAMDATTVGNTARGIADQAVSLVEADYDWPLLDASASLQAWDDSSFTLVWSANDSHAAVVHYLLAGGEGVTSQLVRWTMPTEPRPVTIGGLGFRPDALVHVHTGHGLRDPAPYLTRDAAFGLGVADDAGGQWAMTGISIHGEPGAISRRALHNDACVLTVHADTSVTKHGVCTAMTDDGFAVDFAPANAYPSQIATLAIAGLPVRAGCFTAAPAALQAITGVGFRPAAVLFTSVQAAAGSEVRPDMRVALGGATATTAGAITFSDTADPSSTMVEVQNIVGQLFLTPQAVATIASLDPDGFTIAWSPIDAGATQICFFALGTP